MTGRSVPWKATSMAVLPEGNVMEWTGTTAREAWMFPAESMTRVPSGNAHVAVAVYAAAGLGAEVLEARVPSAAGVVAVITVPAVLPEELRATTLKL